MGAPLQHPGDGTLEKWENRVCSEKNAVARHPPNSNDLPSYTYVGTQGADEALKLLKSGKFLGDHLRLARASERSSRLLPPLCPLPFHPMGPVRDPRRSTRA
jgi:hypothetical protein